MMSPTGSFVSPNYPYPYPNSVECFWTITVARGNLIELKFDDFNMETHSSCEYDYLQVGHWFFYRRHRFDVNYIV